MSKPLPSDSALPLTRRALVQVAALTGLSALATRAETGKVTQPAATSPRVRALADDYSLLYQSPDPKTIKSYSPGLCRLENGRLVATCDLGGAGVKEMSGPKYVDGNGGAWQGRILTSDDGGRTWQPRSTHGLMHARPFVAGASLYVLGHARDLAIVRSDDNGTTWSEPVFLTKDEFWHQAPCNVHYDKGNVYLVMEKRITRDINTWYPGELAPILMRARIGDDLRQRESWTMASALSFRELIPNIERDPQLEFFGVPFWAATYPSGAMAGAGRHMAPMGWLEANVVQFRDPNHLWHDPNGKTFHLWMRTHTGGTGYAALCRVVENADGTMTTSLQNAPSGKKMLYVPCPGGQMKFHVLWDEKTQLFWLLSTQATDSMCRLDRMPPQRYNLPNNERRRLQLHFSKNMVDWCFAGLVAQGPADNASRHYASMIIDGDDLRVLSRSGDERATSAHDGNIITFHTIAKFRELVY